MNRSRDLQREVYSEVPRWNRFLGAAVFILQHYFRESRRLESLRRSNVLSAAKRLKAGGLVEIERRKNLTEREFVRNYLKKGVPVIFDQQAIDWPCTKKWGLDFLKDNYGDDTLAPIYRTSLAEDEYAQAAAHRASLKETSVREFVLSIRNGVRDYARGWPILESHPELLRDLDLAWLRRMRRGVLGASFQTFVGAAGRKTPTHCETTATFFVLAEGEKRWTLISPASSVILNPTREGLGYHFSKVNTRDPDLGAFPGFDRLTRYTCLLKKGDVLFVPPWMWHEVENLSETWGVSYRFANIRGFLRYPALVYARLFLAKPSFLQTLFRSYFKNDVRRRDENLATPMPRIYLKD